jgi:peptidyl-prolyl cis-trans isomerase D
MLQFFRDVSQSWIMRAFFAILVISFVFLWGTEGFRHLGDGSSQVVATVGNQSIKAGEFIREFQTEYALIKERTGTEPAPGIVKQYVLGRMLRNVLLDIEVSRLNLTIGDDLVRKAIHQTRAFQGPSRDFNKDIFNAYLHMRRMTEKQFVEELRQEMKRNQLIYAYTSGAVAPKIMAEQIFDWENEKRKIQLVELTIDEMTGISAPTDAEVEQYYQDHLQNFIFPEERKISVAVLSADKIAKGLQLTDEELAEIFEEQAGTTTGGLPSKTENERIIQEAKLSKAYEKLYNMSREVEDALSSGSTLAQVGTQFGFDVRVLSKVRIDGFFEGNSGDISKEALHQAITAAFTMSQGDEPQMVEADSGMYVMVSVDGVVAAKPKPLRAVRVDVIKSWKDEKRKTRAAEVAQALKKAVDEGKPLGTVISDYGIAITKTLTVERNQEAPVIPEQLNKQVFANKVGTAAFWADGKAVYVAAILNSLPAPKPTGEQIEKYRMAMSGVLAQDIVGELLYSLEKKYRVEVNQALVEAIK